MLKNWLLVGIGFAGTLVTSTALAATDPGSPTGSGSGATLNVNLPREITTQLLATPPAPVNDGFVVITEPVSGCMSDIAIFWNGTTLPAAAQGTADRVLVISDDVKDDDGGPTTGCLSDLDVQRVNGDPRYSPAFSGAGITTLAQLQTQINLRAPGSAGAPLTVAETSTTLSDGGTADNTSFTANGATSSQTYALLDPVDGTEQVPALPPWAVVLLGGALLLPGLYFVKRSRLAGESAAS